MKTHQECVYEMGQDRLREALNPMIMPGPVSVHGVKFAVAHCFRAGFNLIACHGNRDAFKFGWAIAAGRRA